MFQIRLSCSKGENKHAGRQEGRQKHDFSFNPAAISAAPPPCNVAAFVIHGGIDPNKRIHSVVMFRHLVLNSAPKTYKKKWGVRVLVNYCGL
jgi:hypothetical protein